MSRRRYKVGEHLIYDETFDRLKSQSIILNKTAAERDRHPSTGSALARMLSKQGLEGFLFDYTGDEKGRVPLPDTVYTGPAILPSAQKELAHLRANFVRMNEQRIREGKGELAVPPSDLKEQTLKAEARYDVVVEEVDELKKRIDNFVEEEKKIDDAKVLAYGLRGSGTLRKDGSGILDILDGQKISVGKDGVLFIDDPRSPYNGLDVPRYRELCKQWEDEVHKLDRKMREEAEQQNKPYHPNIWTKVPFPPCPEIKQKPKAVQTENKKAEGTSVPVAKGA